jgi:Tfp pilus assembly protein PilV
LSSARNRKRGFTLIEAIVSVGLVAVGIVSIMGAFGKLSHQQTQANTSELMQRLAFEKYDELVATGAIETQALNGDFSDQGDDAHLWDATVDTTGTENLSSLTVSVQSRDGDANDKVSISGMVYVQPQTTTTTPAAGGGQ